MKKLLKNICFLSLCLLFFFPSCKVEEKDERFSILTNQEAWIESSEQFYVVLEFENTKNFSGKYYEGNVISNIKTGKITFEGEFSGNWKIIQHKLVLNIKKSDIGGKWAVNNVLFFDIVSINDEVINLKASNNEDIVWAKFYKNIEKNLEKQKIIIKIQLDPITANLKRKGNEGNIKTFCAVFEMALKKPLHISEIKDVPKVNPKIYEIISFYFNSTFYNELSSFKKIKEKKEKIAIAIKPYTEKDFNDLELKSVLIAHNMAAANEFVKKHKRASNLIIR